MRLGVIFLVCFLGVIAHAQESLSEPGSRPGYTSDLTPQADQDAGQDIALAPVNPDANKVPLSKKIFNSQLSKEFTDSYRRQFGTTEAEQNYNMPTNLTGMYQPGGFDVTPQQLNQEQRQFGLYMGRRTLEYHFDNYAKNSPLVKPAYEFKDKFSQANVQVAPGYKFDGKYSIGGNTFELNFENPFVRSKVVVQMNPGSIGPTAPQEAMLDVGKSVTRTVDLDWQYKAILESMTLVGTKKVTSSLSTSLTGTIFFSNPNLDPLQKGNLILAGMTWNY